MAKQSYSKDDIRRIVKEENVNFLRLMFTDLFGTIKNVEVPVSQLDKLLDNKLMFDGSSIDGFVRIEESDMYLYPDLSTWLIMPWNTEHGKIARIICEVYTSDRKPFEGDPRNNLIRVLNDMREAGYTAFNCGTEPEFFLFKMNEKGEPTTELNDKEVTSTYHQWTWVKIAAETSHLNLNDSALMSKPAIMKLPQANMKLTLSMRMRYRQPIISKHSNWSLRPSRGNTICGQPLCLSR